MCSEHTQQLAPAIRRGLLILVGVVVIVQPVSAGMLATRPAASQGWSPLTPFSVGGGFEYETDSEQSQYDFPLLMEYSVSPSFAGLPPFSLSTAHFSP